MSKECQMGSLWLQSVFAWLHPVFIILILKKRNAEIDPRTREFKRRRDTIIIDDDDEHFDNMVGDQPEEPTPDELVRSLFSCKRIEERDVKKAYTRLGLPEPEANDRLKPGTFRHWTSVPELQLFPYQIVVIAAMVYRELRGVKGGILGDQQGLGKVAAPGLNLG